VEDILTDMNGRQAAACKFLSPSQSQSLLIETAHFSSQPISHWSDGKVPVAWNTLYKSMNEHMEPGIDRWKNGLDAMLVSYVSVSPYRISTRSLHLHCIRLGFSAIVTAFLVDPLAKLEPDEAARTNDLLVNLTRTIYLASIRVQLNTSTLP
jgi:hypothetical protein